MAGSIAQGYGDVRGRMPWWLLGQLVERSSNDEIRTGINKNPQGAQVGSIVVGGATSSKDYTVTINGYTATYTSDGSASVVEIADGLAAAINAEGKIRGDVTALSNGVDTITLTGNRPGETFTASDVDAQLTTTEASTAAATADPIDFGRAVCLTGFGGQGRDDLVAQASTGLFSAQVITIAFGAFVSGQVNRFKVYEVRGTEKIQVADVSEAASTDRDTTVDALVALLNTALTATSAPITVTADAGTATALVFTASLLGYEFDVDFEAGHEGASLQTLTRTYTTGPSPATSLARAFAGVTIRDQAIGAETIGGTEQRYPPNSALAYVRKGMVAVVSTETITRGETVYVELAAGATAGRFYNSSSATRVALPKSRAKWEQDANADTGSLAALRLL